jgi:hypothetical protein
MRSGVVWQQERETEGGASLCPVRLVESIELRRREESGARSCVFIVSGELGNVGQWSILVARDMI